MNEQEYWMNRANQDTVNSNLTQEAQMNYWAMKQDYIIAEALKPRISLDGNQWCCLYGADLHEGIAGFGNTPHDAIIDFNNAFYKK
jgi:hypothetical protein